MRNKNLTSILILLFVITLKVSAYEVWIGTSCTPKNAALKPDTWAKAASLVTGLNINTADFQPIVGTPSENEEPCNGKDWKVIFDAYGTAADNGMVPIPRSAVKSNTYPNKRIIADHLQVKITQAKNSGYGVGSFMIYDNAMTIDGVRVSFSWTSDEIYEIRNWLDNNGHADISIMYNARNVSKVVKDKCSHPAVGDILLEAEPGKWYENAGSRHELLKWLTSDPTTKDKRYVFQIPLSGFDEPFGNPSGFQQLRRWMQWLGTDLMDMNFMRSNQVVILPVTYVNPVFTFYPEIENSQQYTNTMTSIVLSLIEQRDLFEGRTKTPSRADADSYVRTSQNNTSTKNIRVQNKQVTFYPNPVSGTTLYFKFQEDEEQFIRAEILNSLGIRLNTSSFELAKNGIPINNLNPGNFFVRLVYADKIINQTFIVSQ